MLALLAGNKTQLRHVVAPQLPPAAATLREVPGEDRWYAAYVAERTGYSVTYRALPIAQQREWVCPFGVYGDLLWVREALRRRPDSEWEYAADRKPVKRGAVDDGDSHAVLRGDSCQPDSMPRWASRIELEIRRLEVQRLQDISEADARAEGCYALGGRGARQQFAELWDGAHSGGASWTANPWVWALSLRVRFLP